MWINLREAHLWVRLKRSILFWPALEAFVLHYLILCNFLFETILLCSRQPIAVWVVVCCVPVITKDDIFVVYRTTKWVLQQIENISLAGFKHKMQTYFFHGAIKSSLSTRVANAQQNPFAFGGNVF